MDQNINPHIPRFVQNLGPEAFDAFRPDPKIGEQIVLELSIDAQLTVLAGIKATPGYAPTAIIEAADRQFLPNIEHTGDL
jgi:hypothetical protein